MSKEYEIKTKIEQEQWLLLKMLFLLGYNLQIYLMGGNWLLVGGDFSWWGRDEQIFRWCWEDSPPSPSKGNPDLHSRLRCFTMFFILDIKFRVANIKWNLCQNTATFQSMTSPVDKICTNMQTSVEYYLLSWVLASMCSSSQKSWILFSVYMQGSCAQFLESYMNSNDFAVYCHKFFCLYAWKVWFYLMISKLNPSFNFHKEDLVLFRIIR